MTVVEGSFPQTPPTPATSVNTETDFKFSVTMVTFTTHKSQKHACTRIYTTLDLNFYVSTINLNYCVKIES